MSAPCRLDLDIDRVDTITAKHHQACAILSVLSMSFDSAISEPTKLTVQNALWAVQTLMEEAREATKSLELHD